MHENSDLHGNVPDRCSAALLLIDVINDLKFPKNESLVQRARALGQNISKLKRWCRKAGIPAIYVNDNRGKWRSNFPSVVKRCLAPQSPGRHLVRPLVPSRHDYVVMKPKHSSFYSTPLDTLLTYMGVKSIILAGLTTNACVLMTASEVYVRDLHLFVPSDCVAALTEEEHRTSLGIMQNSFGADIRACNEMSAARVLRPKALS